MKKMIFALVIMLTTAVSASAMSYEQARNEALFLTDKMAYELNLTDAQYEAAYEINLDYLMSVTGRSDVFGVYWERRNLDLSFILYQWQWDAFLAASYFYRPLYWEAGYWHFGIYARYPHRDYFYFGRPHFYATYRGGHSWHLNGGHSYYHGRDNHFRPALPQGRQHFGMRNGYERGVYRGSHNGSSTRVTGRPGDRNFDNNRGHNSHGTYNGGSNGTPTERNGGQFGGNNLQHNNRQSGASGNDRPSRSFGSGSRPSGSMGSTPSGTTGSRSSGSMGSRPSSSSSSGSMGNRPSGSMGNRPSGSMGSRPSGSMGSRPSGSMGTTRSAGGSSAGRSQGATSNSHGHFGGSRNH